MLAPAARIEIGSPQRLTIAAVLALSAYGLTLLAPILLSIVAISLLKFGIWSFLIPLLTLVVAGYFLPFGFGNSLAAKLVQSRKPAVAEGQESFLVQLTISPRIRKGLRALIEDADDIGWLRLPESGLVFEGDSVRLSVPWERIQDVRAENAGWRYVLLHGTTLEVKGLGDVVALNFAERSSCVLPSSRRTARRLHELLRQKVAGCQAGTSH